MKNDDTKIDCCVLRGGVGPLEEEEEDEEAWTLCRPFKGALDGVWTPAASTSAEEGD